MRFSKVARFRRAGDQDTIRGPHGVTREFKRRAVVTTARRQGNQ